MLNFRDLRADEIECRAQQVKQNGVILLLYKNARCDMNILDETVGPECWQRDHYECKGNLFCRVGICVETKKGEAIFPEWVWKSDCGTESNTEAEKGEASDSFKRACFNWGIGRELYTSPFIWISSDNCAIKQGNKQGTYACYDRFIVDDIKIENKRIVYLKIYNETQKCVAYEWTKKEPNKQPKQAEQPKKAEPIICADCGREVEPNMAARTKKAFGVCLCVECGLIRSEKQ